MESPPFLADPDRTHEAVLALAKQFKAARRANEAEAARNLEEVIGELNAPYQGAVRRLTPPDPRAPQ